MTTEARLYRPDRVPPKGRESCPFCGMRSPGRAPCRTSTCAACGSVVCRRYGFRDGTCPICYQGLLSGWSHGPFLPDGPVCGYARCDRPAVAEQPRVGYACSEHTSLELPPPGLKDWRRWPHE